MSIKDKQTRNVLAGLNLICSFYPEAKLLVEYDKEIVLILSIDDYVLPTNKKEILMELGWKNLEIFPYMWQYRVDGSIYSYYEEK